MPTPSQQPVVRIPGDYEDFTALAVELRNAADRTRREILELYGGANERLARKVAVFEFAAMKFEEAVFSAPEWHRWT